MKKFRKAFLISAAVAMLAGATLGAQESQGPSCKDTIKEAQKALKAASKHLAAIQKNCGGKKPTKKCTEDLIGELRNTAYPLMSEGFAYCLPQPAGQ